MALFVFISGLLIGSFLNCVIYRIEKEENILGRSYCPKCGHVLSFFDLFPLFSFLLLKGKCRYCKEKISLQYPLVELFTGVWFVLAFLSSSGIIESLYFFIIGAILIVIFVYDLKHFLIPDIATYSAIAVAFFYKLFTGEIINSLLSAFACFLFFLSIFLITRGKGMGFGDVKLAFFIGLFLGYPLFLVALFMSFLIGAIIGTGLIIIKGKNLKSRVPFGPFLIIGTIVALFFGKEIINYYISLI